MKRIRSRFGGAALLAIGAVAIAGCAPQTADAPETPQDAVFLVSAMSTMDPALALGSEDRTVQAFLYDKLIGFDPDTGEVLSNIASEWEITPDAAHFVIRDDITCSDGSPFTAETVVRNLERMKDPNTAAPGTANFFGSYAYTAEVGEDGSSVDITFAEPFAFAASSLAEGPGLVCDVGLDDPAMLAKESAGTGPYVAEKISVDEVVVSLREDYAWGVGGASATEKMPQRVTFRVVADPDAAANLLVSREADIAMLGGMAGGRVVESDASELLFSTQNNTIFFNERPGFITVDPEVRTALTMALSRDDLVAIAGTDSARPLGALTSPLATCGASGELDDALLTDAGAAAAADALSDAGWVKNDSGILEKDGAPLVIRVLQVAQIDPVVEYVRSTWVDLGVDVRVDSRSDAESMQVAFEGKEWDAVIMAYAFNALALNFVSGGEAPEGINVAGLHNADFDAAVEAAMASDPDECDGWWAAERVLIESASVAPLTYDTISYLSTTWDLGTSRSSFFLIPTELAPR